MEHVGCLLFVAEVGDFAEVHALLDELALTDITFKIEEGDAA
jgi:hypothetical protein